MGRSARTWPFTVRYGLLPPDLVPDPIKQGLHYHKNEEADCGHYSRLLEAVKEEGFRNPVLMQRRCRTQIKVPYGTSRLWVGWKLDIPIPAFVSDWTDDPLFADWETILDCGDALTKFKDLPTTMWWDEVHGFQFHGCKQTHLTADKADWKMEQSLKHVNRWRERRYAEGKHDGPYLWFRED